MNKPNNETIVESKSISGVLESQTVQEDLILTVNDLKGGIWDEIKIKLLNNFLSRKFIVLALAVFFFWENPQTFDAKYLVYVFVIYCVTSAADKLIDKFPGGK